MHGPLWTMARRKRPAASGEALSTSSHTAAPRRKSGEVGVAAKGADVRLHPAQRGALEEFFIAAVGAVRALKLGQRREAQRAEAVVEQRRSRARAPRASSRCATPGCPSRRRGRRRGSRRGPAAASTALHLGRKMLSSRQSLRLAGVVGVARCLGGRIVPISCCLVARRPSARGVKGAVEAAGRVAPARRRSAMGGSAYDRR